MGTGFSGCSDKYSGQVLPLLGHGHYRAGCSDMMIRDSPQGDSGVFMRIYYPVDAEDPPTEDKYPIWLARKEYLSGLANFLKTSPRRLQFLSDWIVGEKRMAALWERPLSGSNQSTRVTSSFSVDDFAATEEFSYRKSKLLPSSQSMQALASPRFPVIIFSHGLAGCRLMYSTYCASLASYGFVVAAVEHRDYSACWTYKQVPDPLNGRTKEKEIRMRIIDPHENEMKIRAQQLHKRLSECVKALHVLEELNLGVLSGRADKSNRIVAGEHFNWRQFQGRLDLSRASIAGHSFGAATALAATAFSSDFQAAVCFDAWMEPIEEQMYERFTQPTLFLNAGKWQWKRNVSKMMKGSNPDRSIFTFMDSTHQSFSDFAFLLKNGFLGRKMGLHGETDPITTGTAIVEMTVTFLRKTFDGASAHSTLQQMKSERYPFVVEGSNFDVHTARI